MPSADCPARVTSLGFAVLAVVLLLSGCNRLSPEEQVHREAEDFVQTSLAFSPITATGVGYHNHQGIILDELLDDYSPSTIDGERAFYNQAHAHADQLAKMQLPPEAKADVDVVRLECERQLLDLDRIQSFKHNPTLYVEQIGNSIDTPFIINYAPEAQRFGHIIARLRKLPAFIDTAKKNLVDSPEIWNKVAQEENDGNISLIDSEVRAKVPASLRPPYDEAAAPALAALRGFNEYLRKDLIRHKATWRLGSNYADKLRLTLAAGQTPDQILADAEAQLQAIREEMRAQAAVLFPKYYPGKKVPASTNELVTAVLDQIAKQHSAPDQYFQDAKLDLATATQFVKDHHLLALPPRSNLTVIPTPEFMRGVYSVGGFSPAPALEPQLGAFYWVTPITPDMSPDRVESKLRENNTWGLQILTVHEAMPGHYVQAEYANDVQPKWRGLLRAVFSNGPYVEGWAVYATQLMIDQGFSESPEMHMMFGKQMLRVVSNTILDVKMHTRNMSDKQALDLMIQETFQEQEEATQKLQRAKLSSCQLPTYFAGWQGWESLRADYQKSKGTDFKLAEFHEHALKEGALPLSLLHTLMLAPPAAH
jgi:uncharacterized protein (DUF885 family)